MKENSKNIKKDKLLQWINKMITIEDFKSRYDIHIDELTVSEIMKDAWIEFGMEVFKLGNEYLNKNSMPFFVSIAFSLSSFKKRGISFSNRNELFNELDVSPPSLYLLNKDSDIKTIVGAPTTLLKNFKLGRKCNCYYSEFNIDGYENEYSRVLWCV